MKKIITISLLAVAALASAYYVTFEGKVKTATATVAAYNIGGEDAAVGRHVSVVVTGAEIVYFAPNTTPTDFVRTNAIPVTAGFPYEFRGEMKSIAYATESGTSTFLIAVEY